MAKPDEDEEIAELETEIDDGGEDDPVDPEDQAEADTEPAPPLPEGFDFPVLDDEHRRPTNPDFDRLRTLTEEMAAAIEAGTWNAETYRRIRDEALEAADGDEELLEVFDNEADEEWAA